MRIILFFVVCTWNGLVPFHRACLLHSLRAPWTSRHPRDPCHEGREWGDTALQSVLVNQDGVNKASGANSGASDPSPCVAGSLEMCFWALTTLSSIMGMPVSDSLRQCSTHSCR